MIHQPGCDGVKWFLIGWCQQAAKMGLSLLCRIIENKPERESIPVIASVYFGHTESKVTLSIDGTVRVPALVGGAMVDVVTH